MIAASMRVGCKPVSASVKQPCMAPMRGMARASVRVKATNDPVQAAKDLLAQGMGAIKNIDADKVKAAAANAGSVAKDLQAQAGAAVNMSAGAVKSCIDAALGTWSSYDKDGDGKLTIAEAVALLNSNEVSSAVKQATGMDHTKRTEADIKKWFDRANFDHSGTLSKREFTVMYIGLLADKAKLGAGGLASALCTALDTDGDGKIGSTELKGLLAASGLSLLSNVASMIPEGKDIDYRSLLAKVH